MACQSQRGFPWLSTNDPHLIHLSLASVLKAYGNFLRVERAQQRDVHSCPNLCFLLEFTEYGCGTDVQRSRRIAHLNDLETYVNHLLLYLRSTASVAVVEEQTLCRI
jgi:hypothetical protein